MPETSLSKIALTAAITVAITVSVGIWSWVAWRVLGGKPVIPFSRRRPVPWLGRDVLFIFLVSWFLTVGAAIIAGATVGGAAKPADDNKTETSHPAEQLLKSHEPGTVLLVAFMAVVAAPLVEEFLYRVVLQGWLEAVWMRRRKTNADLRRPPHSWVPVLLPALLFALMHFRMGREPPAPQFLTRVFLASIVADVLTLGIAVVVLRLVDRAAPADFGWQPQKLAADARLALWGLAAVVPPLLVLQVALGQFLKTSHVNVAPDPVPLFFLALVFGLLYQRTHRIAPSLLLHAAFNATSIAISLLSP